jgi:hypothetical protein
MGCYVNPKDMSKERWLEQNGLVISTPRTWDFTSDRLPVLLIDNGPFTAAAVAYKKELDYFNEPDPRPRTWYAVRKAKLYEASDLEKHEKIK